MWSELGLVIKDRAEMLLDDITDSVKERFVRVYSRFLLSVVSVLVMASAISSLFSNLASQLDSTGSLTWVPSITLYLLVVLGSLGGIRLSLKGLDHRQVFMPHERPIKRISQQKRNRRGKRRR